MPKSLKRMALALLLLILMLALALSVGEMMRAPTISKAILSLVAAGLILPILGNGRLWE